MKILNFKARKFAIGKKVIIVKKFMSGSTILGVGEIGQIISDSIENLPDMGLFNIRVIEIKFPKHTVCVGESIAEEYMEIL